MPMYRVQVWYDIGTVGQFFIAKNFKEAFKRASNTFKRYDYHKMMIEQREDWIPYDK